MTAELPLWRAVVVTVLVTVGSFFLLIGTVGLIRLPDVYNRMHATSKAATLGAASMFLAGTVYFGPQGAGLTSLVGILFLFATAPTGAHVISRAAQKMGVPFFGGALWPDPEATPDDAVEGGDTVASDGSEDVAGRGHSEGEMDSDDSE